MKFLIETNSKGKYSLDLCFALEKSITYLKDFKNEDHEIKYSSFLGFQQYPKNYIPVGSINFCLSYLNKYHSKKVYPINIPECLLNFEFTKRQVFYGSEMDVSGNQFVKSKDVFKGFRDIIVSMPPPPGNYLISEVVDFFSEWRAFVFNGTLLDVRQYSGELGIYPDLKIINKMIQTYQNNNAPKAYTLDVGITKKGTSLIEVHDFFSVGLYGFDFPEKLPYMLSQTWNSLVKN